MISNWFSSKYGEVFGSFLSKKKNFVCNVGSIFLSQSGENLPQKKMLHPKLN
jgi:hypothetical protein